MERKIAIILIALFAVTQLLFAEVKGEIYRAYISENMDRWKFVMDSTERSSNLSKQDRLELLNYQYGYIAWCIDKNKKQVAVAYVKKAEQQVQKLETGRYQISTLHAYKAALIGFKIGLAPYKAPFIGKESIDNAKKSVQLDANNAFGYLQLGNISFYMPSAFGGSKKEAMKMYLKALDLMERKPTLLKENWNYLNLLLTIALAYQELDQKALARSYCLKILKIEPHFIWVKNTLYPQLIN